MKQNYTTSELELASFLKARGHRLLSAKIEGKLVTFAFPPEAAGSVDAYIAGEALPVRDVFEAHRALRALIAQVVGHEKKRNENSDGNYR